MLVRQATLQDLPRLSACGREFYTSSKVLREFNIERFCETWTVLLSNGTGVIFLLCDGEEITGTIGGMAHKDLYSNDIIGQEFFWYVLEESRGAGVRLYRAFENWAKERGCSRLRMGYLVDSMPEKVGRFYERLGLEADEVVYSKELK